MGILFTIDAIYKHNDSKLQTSNSGAAQESKEDGFHRNIQVR